MAANWTDTRLLADRYELRERLGHGGFGVVWRAHDNLLFRDVAVKEVEFPTILDEDERAGLREKVLREARAAARLSHPGLVTVFDVVEQDGRPLIVMELVNAPTLAEVVEQHGPLEVEEAAAVGSEILAALSEAHAHGIVHRDIKPGNVMVHETGRVQLTDFGIASIIDDPKVTSSGQLAGSPSFMAPEQAQNQPATFATDLWGLGATLYFALEGEPPFEKDGAIATLTSVVSDDPKPMRRGGALAPLVSQLLSKDPADRPPVEAVRRQLMDALDPEPAVPVVTDPSPTAQLDMDALQEPEPELQPEPEPAPPVAVAAPPPVVETVPAAVEPAPPVEPARRPAPPAPPARSPRPAVAERPFTPARPRRSRSAAGPLVLVVLLAVVALAAFLVVRPDGDTIDPTDTASTPDSGETTGSTAATPASTPQTGRQTAATTATTAARAPAAPTQAPRDWVEYRDEATGFTIAHPPAWNVRTSGTLTDFRDPSTGAYLRVDYRQPPAPSPEGAWEAFEPTFAADYPDYQRIQITPTTFKGYRAAIWEFTYSESGAALHAVDLGFIAGDYGFALNFQTRAADWERMQPIFEQFKQSFQAPR